LHYLFFILERGITFTFTVNYDYNKVDYSHLMSESGQNRSYWKRESD